MKIILLSLTLISAAVANDRPNVLLILADDLGFSDLSCYGGEIPTPNLDRLASGGAKFSAFYTSARCCPSRASLMTGLHPHQAGIGAFTQAKQPPGKGLAYTGHLHPTCATLAEMLGDAGYSTWMVGKWHMAEPGPIERGFQNYFGYKNMYAHSEDQWNAGSYVRLPNGTAPERKVDGDFYVTDVFTDYALEFLQQASVRKEQPWFLYLAHSSPHFPLQAPKETIDKYMETYRRGWDVLRAGRFERQKTLGLIPADAKLPPLSQVPVDGDAIANGFSGMPNPAWDTLPADRREDLARRMATFAAMVEHVDAGVGRIISQLEKSGELDNTLIAFLSDNGACYEWGPFGFDEGSRSGFTKLHTAADLDKMGQRGTHSSYGSGWANLCNTPLNMYKHFCHEGGIASGMFMHWPKGIQSTTAWIRTPSHLMDVVPTVLEATGVSYPKERNGVEITPMEGISLLPAIAGKDTGERALAFEHQSARGLRKGDWKLVWGKRQMEEVTWELYNLANDRSEQTNLVSGNESKAKELIADWESWAKRVGAEPFFIPENAVEAVTPNIANREITISATVKSRAPHGVVVAQGGREKGYALHFVEGVPVLDVRVGGKVTRLSSVQKVSGTVALEATITAKELTLTINQNARYTTGSPGLIDTQPKDGLSLGEDTLSAAGDYPDSNPFKGKVLSHKVITSAGSAWAPGDVPKPLFVDPNYYGSCDPEIVWNEKKRLWYVYYTARRATRESASYVGTPLGVITSRDLRTWRFAGYCSFDGIKGKPDNADTHWAPGVIAMGDELHMFATYKDNATPPWGGAGVIRHYTAPLDDPVHGWKMKGIPGFEQPDPIDVSLLKVGGEFRSYYRVGKGGGIQWATSNDLTSWENKGQCAGAVNAKARGYGYQEAPYVFHFGDAYWMLTDPHEGLAVFRSDDAITWTQQESILKVPGSGPADATLARHPSVAVVDGRAFIFYHTEPNRPYPTPPAEERTVEQKKSFLQMAELKIIGGKLSCDRDAAISL